MALPWFWKLLCWEQIQGRAEAVEYIRTQTLRLTLKHHKSQNNEAITVHKPWWRQGYYFNGWFENNPLEADKSFEGKAVQDQDSLLIPTTFTDITNSLCLHYNFLVSLDSSDTCLPLKNVPINPGQCYFISKASPSNCCGARSTTL